MVASRSSAGSGLGPLVVLIAIIFAAFQFLIAHAAVILIIVLLCGLFYYERHHVRRTTLTEQEAAKLSIYSVRWRLGEIDRWIHIESLRFAFRWTTLACITTLVFVYFFKPISLDDGTLVSGLLSAVLLAVTFQIHKAYLRNSTDEERQRLAKFAYETYPENAEQEGSSHFGEQLFDRYGANLHYTREDYPNENGDNDSNGTTRPRRKRKPDKDDNQSHEQVGVKTCYETLGVAPNATKAEIDAAWHAKIKKIHPDLVARLGPKFQALAEEMTKTLNTAREEALRRV